MHDKVCQDITVLLEEAVRGLRHEAVVDFSALSNRCIHCASIFQDPASLQTAVALYASAKIHQRLHEDPKKQGWVEQQLIVLFEAALAALKDHNEEGFIKAMTRVIALIRTVDKDINLFVDEVLEKARLTKGAKIFRHGISVQRVADMLGVSSWDLRGYLGKTQILEGETLREDPKRRLRCAKKLFDIEG